MRPTGHTVAMVDYPCALGIEIGGSILRMGLVDSDGRIRHSMRASSSHLRDQSHAIELLLADVEGFLIEVDADIRDCAGVGIAAAGLVDDESRRMVLASNLGWRDLEIGGPIESLTGLRTLVDKDTNMSALGELFAGAGRGLDSFIYASVGTGVGGGVIVGGRLLRGIGNRAGEFGHVFAGGSNVCGCGSVGCLETLAGGAWLARHAKAAVLGCDGALPSELAGGDLDTISACIVVQAAEEGDETARNILAQAAEALGIALLNAVRMIYPEAVILGGSIGAVREFIFEPVKAFVEANSILPGTGLPSVRVLQAGLGDSGAIVGAATSVFRASEGTA